MEHALAADDKNRLEKWFSEIGVSGIFSGDDVGRMLQGNIADSGSMVYVIWKMLKERFPEKVDATAFLHDLCFEFGKLHTKNFPVVQAPADFLKKLLSKADIIAWDMKITTFNDEKAVLALHAFPYCMGAERSGASEDEKRYLKKEVLLGIADGLVANNPNLKVLGDIEGIDHNGVFTLTFLLKDKPQSTKNDTSIGVDVFMGSMGFNEAYSEKEVTLMLRDKVGDRGLLVYLCWKMMQKQFPWMDSIAFLYDACYCFGKGLTGKFSKEGTPDVWLRQISSRAGLLVWQQTITSFNNKKAVKNFKYCPHIEAARNAGATSSELKTLCRDILMGADYGTMDPYPYLELSFPGKTCAEGGECDMTCVFRENGKAQ